MMNAYELNKVVLFAGVFVKMAVAYQKRASVHWMGLVV